MRRGHRGESSVTAIARACIIVLLGSACDNRVVVLGDEPEPEIVIVDPKLCLDTLTVDGWLVEPGGLAPALGGGVWVANSTTLVSEATSDRQAGSLVHVDDRGLQRTWSPSFALPGPDRLLVDVDADRERLVATLEDRSELQGGADEIVLLDPHALTSSTVAIAYEPAGLMRLPGDNDTLYFTSRATVHDLPDPAPNPRRLFRITPARSVEAVRLRSAHAELTGLRALALPRSVAFAGEFYVSTLDDDDAWDPSARPGVHAAWRDGATARLIDELRVYDMAFAPDGPFGDALYVVDGQAQLLRVFANGDHEIVAFGLDHPSGLAFADDALYVSEAGRPAVVRLKPCGA